MATARGHPSVSRNGKSVRESWDQHNDDDGEANGDGIREKGKWAGDRDKEVEGRVIPNCLDGDFCCFYFKFLDATEQEREYMMPPHWV